MSEFVALGAHILIQKGKAPIATGDVGKGAEPYLNPEYLRGRASVEFVKAGPDAVRAQDGDTILLWDGSNAGEFFKAKEGVVASTMAKISPDPAFRPAYFFHIAKHAERYLKSQTNGTGIPHVDRELLEGIKVFRPESQDQQKIGTVLDTLDTAIHETEAIIAKLKAVKQGLLHDLLTRGIDANGELRPPQAEAPHLYKQSPLGWVPKEWDVVPLSNLVLDAYRYPSYYGINYVETGVPEVRGECVQPDGILSESKGGYRYISKKTASRFPRVRLTPGDVVMTVRGTIGKFGLVPDWLEGAVITANLLKLSPDAATVKPAWLLRVLLTSAFQDRLDAACSATTIKTIQVPALLDIRIATPLKTEQEEVEIRLSAIHRRLALESKNLEKLKLNKAGLMDDLLTGRVRVTPLLAAEQEGST